MDIFPILKAWPNVPRIDYRRLLCHTPPMSHFSKKFIAILMLLWLPVFNGSALAATVSMQMQQGECQVASAAETMSDMDMSEHHQHHGETPAAADEQSPSCSACGVCHLACTGYLAVPNVEMVAVQTSASEHTPYLVDLHSFTSAPLVPPPLARA